MRPRFGPLWQHPDFLRLWTAQTLSLVGSQVTFLALPLTAAVTLGASPVEMGVLGAIQYLPFLGLGLFAGAWVDRHRRRPVLIAADLGRAALLLLVPLAAWLGVLRLEVVYAVALLTGSLRVFFDVAYTAVLPSLVAREQLVEGNSKLAVSQSVAQIAGPGLAGGLVQLLTAPTALTADALSFLLSALLLRQIHATEPPPTRLTQVRVRTEIGEGMRLVLGDPILRAFAVSGAVWNLAGNISFAVLLLFATRELDLEAGVLGLVFAGGSAGYLLGAVVAGRAANRFGLGPVILGTTVVAGSCRLLVPLAGGPAVVAASLLGVAWFGSSLAVAIANVHSLSLQQAVTPRRLQGRVNATMRFVGWGTVPIGAMLGGALGTWIGLRPTLAVGALGLMLSALPVFLSPLRSLRGQPSLSKEAVA